MPTLCATISSPTDQATFTDLDTVDLAGRVADSNGLGDIVDVTGSSSIDGACMIRKNSSLSLGDISL